MKVQFVLKWCLSVGGIGFLPLCPGTWASIATACAYMVLPQPSLLLWSVVLVLLLLGGVWGGSYMERITGLVDPSWIVLDEVVGMLIVLVALPKSMGWYGAALALFRLFDGTKWCGVRYVERLGGGWGIMFDDVAAALLARAVLIGAVWVGAVRYT